MAAMNQSLEQQADEALADGYRPPEGPYRRTLPSGQRFFTIAEAAMETALAMHPKQGDDSSSAKVKAFYLHQAKRPSRWVDDAEHARELDEIWQAAGLARPAFPMEQYTFDAYALALSKSARGSEWALGKNLTSRETHASILRAATRAAHEKMLRHAIAAGTVTLLHPGTRTPIGAAAAGENALIRSADLVKFAATMPEPIELVEPLAEAQAAPESAPAEQAVTPAIEAATESAQPGGLKTADIASAFSSIFAMSHFSAYRRGLSDSRHGICTGSTGGGRGRGKQRTHYPVLVATYLRWHGAPPDKLNKAFQEEPCLEPWRAEWREKTSVWDIG